MSKRITLLAVIILAIVAGIGLSRAHAAGTPKGYVIAEITVTDPAAYKEYSDAVIPVVAHFGGRYIVRGGKNIGIEGEPPSSRIVVIEFESLAAAKTFEDSPEYKAMVKVRQRSAKSRVFLVEGVQP